jgi:CheY-like chemotaxis protein
MPGKNGTTLISEAHQLDPLLQVGLVTAYADAHLKKEIADIGGVSLVAKPFEIEDILRVLPS